MPTVPKKYLSELHVGQLHGRVLELPSEKKAAWPILLIYGHHSSLERMYSIAQATSALGPVTVPDLPGFGGMMSLGSIGKAASIDNLADYLADFIRSRYPNGQKFVLQGMSLGFVVSVRMLQRHPELAKQIVHLVSIVGFAHYDDFAFPPRRRKLFARTAKLLSRKSPTFFFKHLILQKPVIATTYQLRAHSHPKMKGYTWDERKDLINFELTLWQTNEVHTYFALLAEMLTLDLTGQKIPLPVEHIGVASDQYFNNKKVLEHLEQIFTKVRLHEAHLPNHVPTVIEDVEDARQLLPTSYTKVLSTKL